MTRDEIQNVLLRLPADSPYPLERDGARCAKPLSKSRRLGLVWDDPAFGWNLAHSYAAAGQSLPDFIAHPALVRAHGYVLAQPSAECTDLEIAKAHMLTLPENKTQRDLLRALLACPESTAQSVAELCRLEVGVVELFDTLFWNCLDRRDEPLYLALLCRQSGPTAMAPGPQEDLGLELLRIAYHPGRTELVLAAAGVAPPPKVRLSSQQEAQEMRRALLARAAAGLEAGAFSVSKNPALKPALKMITARKKQKPVEQELPKGPNMLEALEIELYGEILANGPDLTKPQDGGAGPTMSQASAHES